MALKASSLRENIYRILDQVLETGVPVEIERRHDPSLDAGALCSSYRVATLSGAPASSKRFAVFEAEGG